MRITKPLIAVLVGLMLFGLLATAQEQVSIHFLHAMKTTHSVYIDELVAQFMEEYPYITVTTEYGGSYGDVEQKVNAGIVAGNPPTVTQLYENAITPIVDALVPLGEHFTSLELADVIPGVLESATVNGIVYSMPWNKSIMILYYRKDLIETPPTTWQEFYDLAKELTVDLNEDEQIDRWGTILRPKNPENFLNLLHQVGGTLLNEDWTAATVNDAKGLQAMEYVASLIPYSIVGPEYESDYLAADQICMFISTSAGAKYNVSAAETIGAELGYALAPAGPENAGTMVQGANLVVLDRGQTEAQKEAGILFVKFMMRPQNLAYFCVNGNYMPPTYASLANKDWVTFVGEDEAKQVMTAAMAIGFGPLNHPAYSDFRYSMITRYEEVLLEASTPQQALDDLAADFEQYLE